MKTETKPDMKAEEAKRDFARKIVEILMAHGSNEINATTSLPDLNALLDEHYYPKEFTLWAIAPENVGKFWSSGYDEVKINELYNYWKENVK